MHINEVSLMSSMIMDNIKKVIIGKDNEIKLILAALFAGGHVLIDDVPGTGKTMLAKALAKSFNCSFGRIQFTPDLLPTDLTGISFYNQKLGEFTFRKGSLFANILLADEINRATPRTQSGLLESMEERQITVDGQTHPLAAPFFVIATQNPIETHGVYPLPEAQLDRFLMRISLGYPSTAETVSIIKRFLSEKPLEQLSAVCDADKVIDIQEAIKAVHIHDELLAYIVELTEKTRVADSIILGIGTRGPIALSNLSRAYAAISGRSYVIPDDIQCIVPYVYAHRLIHRSSVSTYATDVLMKIIKETKVPSEEYQRK